MLGAVFKGKLDDGTWVAVKSIEGQENGKLVFRLEIFAIVSVDHAHLVCLCRYCLHIVETGGTFFIDYDFFRYGLLDNWIFSKDDDKIVGFLSWKQRYRVAIEVAKALSYLPHNCCQRILHVDIKLENIPLDMIFEQLPLDFGLSKLVSKDASRVVVEIRGTYVYKAPEWDSIHGISEKCDIFSYGQLLLDIFFTQKYAFLDQDGTDIYRRYSDGGNIQRQQ
ncbi:hypothetical protein GIB67_038451 [Kingdonia uniflora]|uniref:Protein kinase domain-containing protein n=1 Tax=Kingdonia uniflora TaxID=39325 RepID=A0A7J7NPQ2_9MAGN|nr:hypothetical protein GIB67_038451 [Kingdonia uniflora]